MTTPMPELPLPAGYTWADSRTVQLFTAEQIQAYAIAAIEASQPKGYQLVPIEPTDAMLYALIKEWDSVGSLTMYENYRAMLSAAPATPPTRGM